MSSWSDAVAAAQALVGFGGVLRLIEAPRLPGSIDLITCATRPGGETQRAGAPGGSGVGLDYDQALVSTVGEAIERLAMESNEEVASGWTEASYKSLGPSALDPRHLNFFRSAVYGTPGFPLRSFAVDESIPWCRGFSHREDRGVWVPAEYAYFSSSALRSHHWFATTSGVASHRSHDAALQSALCELIERDAFVAAWLRGLPLPVLDPLRFDDGGVEALLSRAARTGVSLELRALPTNFGIPAALGLATTRAGTAPSLGLGAAAHPSPADAARKALLESVHTWNWAYRKIDHQGLLRAETDPLRHPLADFGDHVYLYAHPWMRPRAAFLLDCGGPPPAEWVEVDSAGLSSPLASLLRDGHDVIEIDQTPALFEARGYHVVRALVPTMLPLQPGRRIQSLASARLPELRNPDPHPFP